MSVPENLNETWRTEAVDLAAALITHIGLADENGNEIAGGAPAYARQAVVWNAGVAGFLTANADLTFDVPAGVYVNGWLGFSALVAGTNYGGARLQRVGSAAQYVYTLYAANCSVALTTPV